METRKPITSAQDAIRYAKKQSVNPTDWPQIIYVDEKQRPLPRNQGGGTGFIVVEKRAGDPSPKYDEIMRAEAIKKVADQLDRSFIDFIIIGSGGLFYSFACERVLRSK